MVVTGRPPRTTMKRFVAVEDLLPHLAAVYFDAGRLCKLQLQPAWIGRSALGRAKVMSAMTWSSRCSRSGPNRMIPVTFS